MCMFVVWVRYVFIMSLRWIAHARRTARCDAMSFIACWLKNEEERNGEAITWCECSTHKKCAWLSRLAKFWFSQRLYSARSNICRALLFRCWYSSYRRMHRANCFALPRVGGLGMMGGGYTSMCMGGCDTTMRISWCECGRLRLIMAGTFLWGTLEFTIAQSRTGNAKYVLRDLNRVQYFHCIIYIRVQPSLGVWEQIAYKSYRHMFVGYQIPETSKAHWIEV